MTKKVAKDLIDYGLDAINIDIKGDADMVKKYCGTDVEKVWRNANFFVKNGVHLEITTLLIQGLNTDEKIIRNIAKRIKDELGEDTPFHLTRAFPRYKSWDYGFTEATPVKTLYKNRLIAKKIGLNKVYLGNI
jgi:pyruvate formate lyase activating enzyme